MSEKKVHDITRDKSPKAFTAALAQCSTGDRIIYHRGKNLGGLHHRAAMQSYYLGQVTLVQKRVRDGKPMSTFEYIAVRLSHKRKSSERHRDERCQPQQTRPAAPPASEDSFDESGRQ